MEIHTPVSSLIFVQSDQYMLACLLLLNSYVMYSHPSQKVVLGWGVVVNECICLFLDGLTICVGKDMIFQR